MDADLVRDFDVRMTFVGRSRSHCVLCFIRKNYRKMTVHLSALQINFMEILAHWAAVVCTLPVRRILSISKLQMSKCLFKSMRRLATLTHNGILVGLSTRDMIFFFYVL